MSGKKYAAVAMNVAMWMKSMMLIGRNERMIPPRMMMTTATLLTAFISFMVASGLMYLW